MSWGPTEDKNKHIHGNWTVETRWKGGKGFTQTLDLSVLVPFAELQDADFFVSPWKSIKIIES